MSFSEFHPDGRLILVSIILQNELAAQRQDFGFAKEKRFQKKVKLEKQAYIAKMTSAEQTKEEKFENEQRLAEYKLTRRLSALEKKDAVKKSMMKSQRKLDSYRMQKIQAVSHATLVFGYCQCDLMELLNVDVPWLLRRLQHGFHCKPAILAPVAVIDMVRILRNDEAVHKVAMYQDLSGRRISHNVISSDGDRPSCPKRLY